MTDIVGNKTLRDLWEEQSRKFGGKTALIFQNCQGNVCEYTYSQLNEQINKTANLFLELGIQKQDKVAIQLNNCPEFFMCWFGLAKIGAVAVPLNAKYTKKECEYILQKCGGINTVVVEEKYLPFFYNKEGIGSNIQNIILARSNKKIPGIMNFSEYKDGQPAELQEFRPLNSDDVAEILFTSGTTSKPKGAVITHCNLLYAGIYAAWQLSIRHEDRFLNTVPACHIDFQSNTAMSCITVGATIILIEKYSARRFWKQICTYKATVTECIPMIIRTLMLQPQQEWERNHSLHNVYFYLNLTDEEKNSFEERFHVQLQSSYGSTENLVGVIGDPPTGERRWPSIGKVGLSYEAKIVDEDGKELSPNKIGEICIKGIPGRTIMREYFNDPEATAKAIKTDGWLYTGDKGYVDEDGWFYFVDRKVSMIKRAGENISSTEVENILMKHPKINEAAVIGVPDPIRDQAVKAFVVLNKGEELTVQEILDYCKSHLAEFKIPSFVEMLDRFPRTCTGKIEKKLLK